jgi:hypothetical protein
VRNLIGSSTAHDLDAHLHTWKFFVRGMTRYSKFRKKLSSARMERAEQRIGLRTTYVVGRQFASPKPWVYPDADSRGDQ